MDIEFFKVHRPVTVYFGERWDAPILDGAIQQTPVPVGQHCLFCEEPIAADDRGLLRLTVRESKGKPEGSTEPAHMECDLRMATGSKAHITGKCSCHSAEPACDEGTFREEAREVLNYFNELRAGRGMPPL